MSPVSRKPDSRLIVIPARMGSTRFPGKVLADLRGRPWIQWVYEAVSKWPGAQEVWVATEDQSVYDAVKRFGGEVRKTTPGHPTGTDRCSEAARHSDASVIVNLQADELLMDAGILDDLLSPFDHDDPPRMATLKREITLLEEWMDPNVVKLVTDHAGNALYFSRSPIPHDRHRKPADRGLPPKIIYKHLGIYAFGRDFLLEFPKLPESRLEAVEGLEQMRALEAGIKIRVVETERETFRVDTPEDLEWVKTQIPTGNHRMENP
jgi:3-deoxy-manno-octulosonate cytidylyltransferase (CMP-KDO synthetase)